MTTNSSKRGRPPFADGTPRRVSVCMTIRQDILEQVDRLAAERGSNRSEVVNELLDKALSQ